MTNSNEEKFTFKLEEKSHLEHITESENNRKLDKLAEQLDSTFSHLFSHLDPPFSDKINFEKVKNGMKRQIEAQKGDLDNPSYLTNLHKYLTIFYKIKENSTTQGVQDEINELYAALPPPDETPNPPLLPPSPAPKVPPPKRRGLFAPRRTAATVHAASAFAPSAAAADPDAPAEAPPAAPPASPAPPAPAAPSAAPPAAEPPAAEPPVAPPAAEPPAAAPPELTGEQQAHLDAMAPTAAAVAAPSATADEKLAAGEDVFGASQGDKEMSGGSIRGTKRRKYRNKKSKTRGRIRKNYTNKKRNKKVNKSAKK